jgi:hypothetical protein
VALRILDNLEISDRLGCDSYDMEGGFGGRLILSELYTALSFQQRTLKSSRSAQILISSMLLD